MQRGDAIGRYEFDVAISFAGSEREVARTIALVAKDNGLRVFFDESYPSELWGKNLVEELSDIYTNRARFCLIICSVEYARRAYTNAERRAALDRALRSENEYILPVRTDEAWIEGLPEATRAFDLRESTAQEIGRALVMKVKGTKQVRVPESAKTTKLVALSGDDSPVAKPVDSNAESPLQFVNIALHPKSEHWKEERGPDWNHSATKPSFSDCLQEFNGPEYPADPTFDVTIMNLSDRAVVLSAVGLEVLTVDSVEIGFGGAVVSTEIELSQILLLELPDMWAPLAGASKLPVDVHGESICRLPSPVLMQAGAPYRFGLCLFDYWSLMPNVARVRFLVETGLDSHTSHPVLLTYTLPGCYGGAARIALSGDDRWQQEVARTAEYLWRREGQPPGRDEEFWFRAEGEVKEHVDYMRLKRRPPLIPGGGPARRPTDG